MKLEFGKLFQAITGTRVADCSDLQAIDKIVEEKQNRKMHIKRYRSNVVPNRGNIFSYSSSEQSIDQKIDQYIVI